MQARAAKKTQIETGGRFFLFKSLVFVFAAVTIWLLLNIDTLQEFLDTYYKRNQEVEQIESLNLRIRTLRKERHSLEFNGIAREREVRERIGMHKPGERVIFLQPEQPAATQTPATGIAEPADKPAAKPAAGPAGKTPARTPERNNR